MFGYENDELSAMLVAGVLIIISVLGVIANGFLLYVLSKLPGRSVSFQLIKLIAVADLFLCGFTCMLSILRPILGYPGAYTNWFYCPVFGSMTFFCSGTSSILMSFLAVERYSVICHQRGLSRSLIMVSFSIVATTFGVLLAGNSIAGGSAPDPSFMFCMPEGTTWSKVANYAFYLLLNVPVAAFVFCYVSIFVKCYRSSIPNQADSITRKAAIQSLLLLVVYFICYMPKFLTTVIGIFYGLNAPPKTLYVLIPIGMTSLTLVNPIMVLHLHRQVKNVVSHLISNDKSKLQGSAIRLE
ncbi:hypothetical protein L0F63_002055, partial [Massospora cicadina]